MNLWILGGWTFYRKNVLNTLQSSVIVIVSDSERTDNSERESAIEGKVWCNLLLFNIVTVLLNNLLWTLRKHIPLLEIGKTRKSKKGNKIKKNDYIFISTLQFNNKYFACRTWNYKTLTFRKSGNHRNHCAINRINWRSSVKLSTTNIFKCQKATSISDFPLKWIDLYCDLSRVVICLY